MEAITGHWDGYAGNANNYYFYDDPTSGLVELHALGTTGRSAAAPSAAGRWPRCRSAA
ncbi:MAG: hypothetical protein R3F43_05020 [bacterium]